MALLYIKKCLNLCLLWTFYLIWFDFVVWRVLKIFLLDDFTSGGSQQIVIQKSGIIIVKDHRSVVLRSTVVAIPKHSKKWNPLIKSLRNTFLNHFLRTPFPQIEDNPLGPVIFSDVSRVLKKLHYQYSQGSRIMCALKIGCFSPIILCCLQVVISFC